MAIRSSDGNVLLHSCKKYCLTGKAFSLHKFQLIFEEAAIDSGKHIVTRNGGERDTCLEARKCIIILTKIVC